MGRCALCHKEIEPEATFILSLPSPQQTVALCSLGCVVSWSEREMSELVEKWPYGRSG